MKINMPDVSIQHYDYTLPEQNIAQFPTEKRDDSRLLVYQNANVSHQQFKNLPDLLPENSLLLFNNTKVIPARIYVQKASGTTIELFLLRPSIENKATQEVMQTQGSITWETLVGNKKRWKTSEVLEKEIVLDEQTISLQFTWLDREANAVTIAWSSDHPFASILDAIGKIPLPPYMDRESDLSDQDRYQTLFSDTLGAVAAPTASLHFSQEILDKLISQGVKQAFLTLHVGAGTFLPVKEDNVRNHPMHREQLIFTKAFIQQLIEHNGPFIPVGTTSLRAVESLYWAGIWLIEKGNLPPNGLIIPKEFAYIARDKVSTQEALQSIIDYLTENQQDQLIAETELLIMPGYELKFCDALVTNFHQPKSTLLVLVSAIIGDAWKSIYEDAVEKNYRFLSYGDACLFIR